MRNQMATTAREIWGGGRGWTIVFVAMGWLLVLGTRLVVPAVLPQIQADFNIDNTTAGLAMGVILTFYATMQFPAGILVDRFGEKFVLLLSLCIGLLSLIGFAYSPTFTVFLVACVIFGLGTGLYGNPRVTILSNIYPKNTGIVLGFTFAAGSIGAATLPFTAGLITESFNWRYPFALAVIPFLIAILGVWRLIPNVKTGTEQEVFNSVSETAGRLLEAVTERTILLSSGAILLMVFSYQGFTAFLPAYFIAMKGIPQGTAVALYSLFFLTGAVVQPVAGQIADHYGSRRVMVILAAGHGVALMALPFIHGLVPLGVLVIILGTRTGIGPVNNGYIVGELPDAITGASYGLLRTAFMVTGAAGPVFVGFFADRGWFDQAFMALAAIAGFASVFYWALPRR